MDVIHFGLWGGALYGGELDGADLGQEVEQACEGIGADAGFSAVGIPFVSRGDCLYFALQTLEIAVLDVHGFVIAVQDRDGVGDARQKAAHGEAVAFDVDAAASTGGEILAEAVGLVEGGGELAGGNLEPHVAKVLYRCEAMMRDFVDVEGELGLDVLVCAFGVVDSVAVFRAEPGELDRDGLVGGTGVADVVADVVGEGTDSEGEFIGILRIAEEVNDEVAAADVVGEV